MTANPPDTEFYAVNSAASPREFLAAAKVYARDVARYHDLTANVTGLDWEVSKRAKRRAGAVKYRDDTPHTVSLTWEHFQKHGWAATAETIRHELIHVHLLNEHNDATHGPAFQDLAAELQTPVTCDAFADPNWWVVCNACGSELPRYRKSRLVENPSDYRCGDCGGTLTAHPADRSDD